MSARKGLVLDANFLLRAVFGKQVRHILEKYEDEARFYTPDVCFRDAQKYIPIISKGRKFGVGLSLTILDQIGRVWSWSTRAFTKNMKAQLALVSVHATQKTDRLSRQPCSLLCQFGRRIKIFLALASRLGHRTASNYTCGEAALLSVRFESDSPQWPLSRPNRNPQGSRRLQPLAQNVVARGNFRDRIGMDDIGAVGQRVAEGDRKICGSRFEGEALVADGGGAPILGDGDDDDGKVKFVFGTIGNLDRTVNPVVVNRRRIEPLER